MTERRFGLLIRPCEWGVKGSSVLTRDGTATKAASVTFGEKQRAPVSDQSSADGLGNAILTEHFSL
jgi:hypothetical protein